MGDAFSTQDQQKPYRLAEAKLAAAAEESELARRAEENTKLMLIGLFGSLGIDATFNESDAEE